MLPSEGLIDQVAAAPMGRFLTANCWVPEGAKVADAGVTLGMPTPGVGFDMLGPTKTVALAFLAGSARLTAEIVTKVSELTEPGAVYAPLTMEPEPWVMDHSTCWSELPATDAAKWVVCPAYR
jgi:hypothetical protein